MDSPLRKQKKILFIARTEKCECAFSPNFLLIMIHCCKMVEMSSPERIKNE